MDDHLSGTSLVTKADGSANGTMKYYPFGVCRNSPENFPTDKLFTGQRLDDTGLYYYGARYYDANIGRFISADTIIPNPANPQAFNRYSYCLNNPLKYVDPSGHDYYMAMCAWGARKPAAEDYGDIDSYAQDMIAWQAEANTIMEAYGVVQNTSTKVTTLNTVEANAGALALPALGYGVAALPESLIFIIPIGIGYVGYEGNQWVVENENFDKPETILLLSQGSATWLMLREKKTAREIISDEKRGSIIHEFPGEWLDRTYKEIKNAARKGDRKARSAKKLLDGKEYDKHNKK